MGHVEPTFDWSLRQILTKQYHQDYCDREHKSRRTAGLPFNQRANRAKSGAV